MVFEGLSQGLRNSITKLRRAIIVDKRVVREFVRDIQKTLLAADVNVELVLKISKRIEERGLLEKPPGMLDRKENLIRITYEELVNLLGGGERLEIKENYKILLVGIQGSGKTTTVVKLGKFLKKRGMNPKVICADTFRAGAYEQLKQLSEEANLKFYGNPNEKNSLKIIEEGIRKFGGEGPILIDSEGRHKFDDEMMDEINRIYEKITPDLTLLVLDSTIGQDAGEQARAFAEKCNVNGVILTKLDGSAKGGGALSACAATNSRVYFIGTGEHIDDFEEFNAERFVSRLIGFGDLRGLLEKAKEVEFDEKSAKRFMTGKFTLEDLYTQIEQISKMGSLRKLIEMLPLGTKIPKDMLDIQEEKLRIFRIIMDSMTKEEMQNPEIIKRSRVERIARGSGRKTEEVRELLNYYKRMKKMMKTFGDERRLRRLMRRFSGI
ncbi:MAG: signal recognition particle protein [Candidatus Altiarchaeales archaeon]|nr:MAG: signal recognition particle protein [Candidatus Altiarchaeales archaeon]RLI95037.1 MAG: signal recognition particle protein [Candidatus Altiarchaeales archaeon]HDO82269.1 signal recognition particle protein [Candidatus Altiarchaeales archaeon]HEX54918.1 signal recognition particle protein [Candidatus Altiarchaeales archaeon]